MVLKIISLLLSGICAITTIIHFGASSMEAFLIVISYAVISQM